MKSYPLIWITKTTTFGDTSTRIGIAEHLGGNFAELEIPEAYCPLDKIKSRLVNAKLIDSENIQWPEVIIGPCFHIPYMQDIKRLSNNKSVVVALRPPVRGLEIKAAKYDIEKTDIIVSYPYHNNEHIPNIMLCESLANRVSSEHLKEGKAKWAGTFKHFFEKGPVIGLLMGGDIGNARRIFSAEMAMKLGESVNKIAQKMGASLLISVSARTSLECKRALCSKINVPYYMYDPKCTGGDNPYFGILGSVDYVVVTADSISMCNEAASSGAPVYIYYDENIVEGTHTQVVEYLVNIGAARLLNNVTTLDKFLYTPENSAKKISEKVFELLLEKSNAVYHYGT